jgi:hypothetical protein
LGDSSLHLQLGWRIVSREFRCQIGVGENS